MNKNMLKTLLLSTLCASAFAFVCSAGAALAGAAGTTTTTPTGLSQGAQNYVNQAAENAGKKAVEDAIKSGKGLQIPTVDDDFVKKTKNEAAQNANKDSRDNYKTSKQAGKNADKYGKEAEQHAKNVTELEKKLQQAQDEVGALDYQIRDASDHGNIQKEIEYAIARKEKEDEIDRYTRQIEEEKAKQNEARKRQEEEIKKQKAAKKASDNAKDNRDEIAAGDTFETLMWMIRDKDFEIAEGELSQAENLRVNPNQKILKKEDAEVKEGRFAQNKKMAVGEADAVGTRFTKDNKADKAQLKQFKVVEADAVGTRFTKDDETDREQLKKFGVVADDAVKTRFTADTEKDQLQIQGLAQQDNFTQDYLVGKDYVIWDESAAGEYKTKFAQEDNETQNSLIGKDQEIWGLSGSGFHTATLHQEDNETQDYLVGLDYEVWDLSALGYHWWVMDYGLAREWALRPLEFGYLSYHAALHDTMGGFSSAEMMYSTIFDIATLGINALNGVSGVIGGIEDIAGAIGDFFKDDLVKDINNARKKKEEAMARSADFDTKTIEATNKAQKLLGIAENAENQADLYADKSKEYDETAKKAYELEQRYMAEGREDLAEIERMNKEQAMLDSASMWNKSLEESQKASDARAASQAAQADAEKLWKQKTLADSAAQYYENEENNAKGKLRKEVGATDSATNLARSDARMKQAEQGKKQADAALAQASANKEEANKKYEQSMNDAQEADRIAAEKRLAAGNASKIGDADSYTRLSKEASEAEREADQYRTDAATSKRLADSYAMDEARYQKDSDEYGKQINKEKEYQVSEKANLGVSEAEYAVLTGTATEEQKKLYAQKKQYDENHKLSKQADEWAKKVPTPTEIVRGAGDVVSQGGGKVVEVVQETGAGEAVRTINTTRRIFGW